MWDAPHLVQIPGDNTSRAWCRPARPWQLRGSQSRSSAFDPRVSCDAFHLFSLTPAVTTSFQRLRIHSWSHESAGLSLCPRIQVKTALEEHWESQLSWCHCLIWAGLCHSAAVSPSVEADAEVAASYSSHTRKTVKSDPLKVHSSHKRVSSAGGWKCP